MAGIDTIHDMLLDGLIQKFGSFSRRIEEKIRLIQREDICRELQREIFRCESIEQFKKVLSGLENISGKSGFKYGPNYDVSMKWLGNRYKGKLLEIFDIKTGPITEVFDFEYVRLRVDFGRVDLMFKDAANDICHLEEERDMKEEDLHRFAIYHFHAVRRWGENVRDIIITSGKPYNGPKEIKTKSGRYSPVIIDLTQKDGEKRLQEIKEEINAGNYDNVVELVFIPVYGSEDHGKLASKVLEYEIMLMKEDKLDHDLVFATMIMSNKIIDKDKLKKYYEEVKNMLDILNIAREDGEKLGVERGMQKGIQKGIQKGMQKGIQKGIQKGMQKGERNKAVQIARGFKKDGFDIAIISKHSGLSVEEIKDL
jgi:hypothetical protein